MTSFEFDLHPVGPTVLGGPLLFPADRAREVLAFYRDFISSARPAVGSIAGLRTAPPLQWVPANVQGTPVLALMFCYAGPVEEGMELLRPFQTTLRPIAQALGPRPFTELQAMMDSSVPAGLHYYWKSHFLPTLSDGAIETLVAHGWKKRSPTSYSLLFHMGGAIRQKTDADTAFTGRLAEHALNINGAWDGKQPQHNDREWVRAMFDAMLPFAMGVYVNFLMEEGKERVLAAYGPEKYRKLAALKARYDPSNLLHLNQNIVPAS